MTYEKALYYLIGALRDGSVYKYEETRNYYIIWYSSNKAYLKRVICRKLHKLGISKCNPYMYKPRQYRVRISSKKLYEIIVSEFGHPLGKGSKKRLPWPTPEPIKNAPIDLQLEYIRGFVDAEGSIIRSNKGIQIDMSQGIREPLEFIKKTLEYLGIKSSGIYLGNDNVWRLRMSSKEALIRFAEIIGFRHPCKLRRLKQLLLQ